MSGVAEEVPATRAPPDARPRSWLRRLSVRDFRNLERVEIVPPPEGLALIGDNGHGKTNVLEAIYYLQLLRSFRGAHDQDLVRFGAAGFHLAAEIANARARTVTVGFQRAGRRKKVTIDGAESLRLTDALGAFPAVIVSPRDVQLVAGAPSERRRYLDVMLALTSRRYLASLQRYRAALSRRNAALREAAQGRGVARVEAWDPVLAEHGAVIWRARREWIDGQAAHFGQLTTAIGEQGRAEMRYATSLEDAARADAHLLDGLARRRSLDIQRGVTHTGPHRDDLELRLDGHELRTFGSAGQQRTAAIALRLLEASTLRASFGGEPITLLDDPFAELDHRRAARILELLNTEGRGQTILAVPRPADIPGGLSPLERWRVEMGSVTRERS